MRVSIIGTGYVGLTTGVCLAAKGARVTCHDTNPAIVESLNRSRPTIHETGLDRLLGQVVADGSFNCRLMDEETFSPGEVTILAVGTPTVNGRIDMSQVVAASRMIGRRIRVSDDFVSVVVKSTVVPGSTDTVVRQAIEEESGKTLGVGFGLGMNPEFLREGEALADFMHPDRIVLGHDDPETLRRLRALYAPWDCDKIETGTRTAEMIKYANNCLLATQISAINELANISAAKGGIEIMDVVEGVRLDKRWNPVLPAGGRANPGILDYLVPGCGFGGSCFPKDVQALRRFGRDNGIRTDLLDAVLSVNDRQSRLVADLLETACDNLASRRIMILGLAFKPDTDDVRESVSLKIIEALAGRCGALRAHDPIAVENCRKVHPETEALRYVSNWDSEIDASDAVVIATKWSEYGRLLSDTEIHSKLTGKIVLDPRHMFRPENFPQSEYLSVGRRMNVT